MNVTLLCYLVVVSGKATLNDLQTVYGLEDAYDLLEIASVQRKNEASQMPDPVD